VGGLDGKGDGIHPLGSRFKSPKWHGLWLMLDVDQIFHACITNLG